MVDAANGLSLSRDRDRSAETDALAELCGGRVGLGVLDDLNRRAHRGRAPGRAVHRAIAWDAADSKDPLWWPQGITTSLRTEAHRDVLAVAWYRRSEARGHDGVRLSLLDPERLRYRHVLLVRPVLVDGRVQVRPLRVHAGGLVWQGRHLHVAATAHGFWTCRLEDLVRVPDRAADRLDHRGHRYLLPVRTHHRAEADGGTVPLRHSFFTLDRSGEPGTDPSLVVGEYGGARRTRRVIRYPLDPESGLPAFAEDGRLSPVYLSAEGHLRMQGVAIADGTFYVSASCGRWTLGTMYAGDLTEPHSMDAHRFALPMGPEDLVWWPETDQLWCPTEHPRRRWVVAMPRSRFG